MQDDMLSARLMANRAERLGAALTTSRIDDMDEVP